jgi:hypothetical protein
MTRTAPGEFTEEWLLKAIDTVSFCIVEDGAVYAPILERLENELELVRRKDDVVARARRNVELRNQRLAEACAIR